MSSMNSLAKPIDTVCLAMDINISASGGPVRKPDLKSAVTAYADALGYHQIQSCPYEVRCVSFIVLLDINTFVQ